MTIGASTLRAASAQGAFVVRLPHIIIPSDHGLARRYNTLDEQLLGVTPVEIVKQLSAGYYGLASSMMMLFITGLLSHLIL